MDPFAVLGVPPGSPPEDIVAAYRRLAKRWHPDNGGGDRAQRRMSEINAAYAVLRGREPSGPQPSFVPRPPRRRGSWLPATTRRALGPELLSILEPDEDVPLVVPCSTWASPQTVLAITDRRLAWLLDDAPTNRVRTLKRSRSPPSITGCAGPGGARPRCTCTRSPGGASHSPTSRRPWRRRSSPGCARASGSASLTDAGWTGVA